MICGIAVAVIVAIIWWLQQEPESARSVTDSLTYPMSSLSLPAEGITETVFSELVRFFRRVFIVV